MILLVDLCFERESLSRYEFVDPIADALNRAGFSYRVAHYTEMRENEMGENDGIILCGTALKDNVYAEHLESFAWIKSCEKPILGICAGMQVIGAVFGGCIVSQPAIGLEKIKIVRDSPLLGEPREIEGYHLHNFGVSLPEGFQILAGTPKQVAAFQHTVKPAYGIIFHPEVRNKWIIEKFAALMD
jgi:GMP synthase-like glutamine amidotransferase